MIVKTGGGMILKSDTYVNFGFSPQKSTENQDVVAFRQSFWESIDKMMTEWGHSGFQSFPETQSQHPIVPVSFERDGRTLTRGILPLPCSAGTEK